MTIDLQIYGGEDKSMVWHRVVAGTVKFIVAVGKLKWDEL